MLMRLEFNLVEVLKNSDGKIIKEEDQEEYVVLYDDTECTEAEVEEYVNFMANSSSDGTKHSLDGKIVSMPKYKYNTFARLLKKSYELVQRQ